MTAPGPTPSTDASAAAPARAEKAFRGAVLVHAVLRLWRSWRSRREIGDLLEMDEWMLKDIGLSRGDVHDAMAGRFTIDPSSRLGSAAARHIAAERSRMRDSLRRDEALTSGKALPRMHRAA